MISGLSAYSRRLGAKTIANLPFPLRKKLVAPLLTTGLVRGRQNDAESPSLTQPALMLPRLDMMAVALDVNPSVVATIPPAPAAMGSQVEKLVGLLGGRVRNCFGCSDEALAEVLDRVSPSIIIGSVGATVTALGELRKQQPAQFDRARDALRFLVNVDPLGPLSRARLITTERTLDADVTNVFTDAFSFVFMSCPCGAIHPLPHYHLEVVNKQGNPTAGPGRMVVSDRLRSNPPVTRYATPYRVTVYSSPCSFFGQAAGVTCHGRQGEQLHTPAGDVGLLDLEDQLFTHGLFSSYSVRVDQDGWRVAVCPFPGEDVDAGAAAEGLCTRFKLPVEVDLMQASPWGPVAS